VHYAVTGVDSSDMMIDMAREKARKICSGKSFFVRDL
jgi:ubiquinone/menaquinone biosynthesis C-methylase UbiE